MLHLEYELAFVCHDLGAPQVMGAVCKSEPLRAHIAECRVLTRHSHPSPRNHPGGSYSLHGYAASPGKPTMIRHGGSRGTKQPVLCLSGRRLRKAFPGENLCPRSSGTLLQLITLQLLCLSRLPCSLQNYSQGHLVILQTHKSPRWSVLSRSLP